MAKIHRVKISHFRGINSFEENFYKRGLICLVGRGDSGKSTILEAISDVLTGKWNINFFDTDFYNSDVDIPIEIEITLTDVPEQLFSEFKYFDYKRAVKLDGSIIDNFEDGQDDLVGALTIRLVVDKSLDPEWFIICDRHDPKLISSKDRALLNVFLISDFSDNHFSWNQGSPLYSLLRKGQITPDDIDKNLLIESFREAKNKIDQNPFTIFEDTITRVKSSTAKLGLDIGEVSTTVDFRDILVKSNSVCLHGGDKIPLRLKGKGSKRIISVGIQQALASDNGIILIDEIEQGLEPDRVKNLVRAIASNDSNAQVFMSTHSQSAVEELDTDCIYVLKNKDGMVTCTNKNSENFQKVYRACAEAIYAKKVIVCEGRTEVGICRAYDSYRIENNKNSLSFYNVVYTDGGGANLVDRALCLSELGKSVLVICDSDVKEVNDKKQNLKDAGVEVVDWGNEANIEAVVFGELPWDAIVELVNYRIDSQGRQSFDDTMKNEKLDWDGKLDSLNNDTGRSILGKVSGLKTIKENGRHDDKSWFKSIKEGEFLGSVIFKNLNNLSTTSKLKTQISVLTNWVN